MKVKAILSLAILISMTTNVALSNPTKDETKKNYKRPSGSSKVLKVFKIHKTHDTSEKRVYNTSNKQIKRVESSPDVNQQKGNKTTSNSIHSFKFKNKSTPYIDNDDNKTSPFRANKNRR